MRKGNVHSADDWRSVLEPVVARHRDKAIRTFFRGDAAFARPGFYESPQAERYRYAIRLPANARLWRRVKNLSESPPDSPVKEPITFYATFSYRAESWDKPRRVVPKVEWPPAELFRRLGFIVTNLTWSPSNVVEFNNGRGTAEQWIKEGKHAVNWTRLSCHHFVDNPVRLQLFALAYNLGNFHRRLALPEGVSYWLLTTLRDKLIKIAEKVVRHARYVTFQLAEVAVPRELFRAILGRIRGPGLFAPLLVPR